jgi:hypothetical protein
VTQVGATAGIAGSASLRGRELISGVPGEFGHVGEADEGGLLAAPELGDLAIDTRLFLFGCSDARGASMARFG